MEESTLHIDTLEADLIRFISGACSTRESERIYELISSDTDVLKKYQELTGALQQYDASFLENKFDSNRAKTGFLAIVDQEQEETYKTRSFPGRKLRWMWAAASIVVLMAATFFYLLNPRTVALETGTNILSEYALPDDSKVWINANTQLRYPKRFGKTRSAELSGEAYFEIKSDSENPFLIHTPGAIVRVVGTRLNIRDYPGDTCIEVTVAEGKVELLNLRQEQIATVIGGEGITLHKNSGTWQTSDISEENYQAWKTGTLKFQDTPLQEALEKISRYYNTPIRLLEPAIGNRRINSTFTNDSLETVLEILSFMYGVDIQSKDSIIYITSRE